MDMIFLKILNMSITASWLILAVLVLRLVLKKAPKIISCVLWAIVAVRLVCPFSFESVFSLIPSTQTVSPDILYSQTPGITSGIPAINSAVNPVITGSLAPELGASVNPLQIWIIIASCVWLLGAAAMLGYALVSYLRIKRKVREGAPLCDNIWLCDHIDTPFILGILRPHIYLPSAMGEAQSDYVIAHENAHLKRRDHWWKPLGFLLLAIYWFNPLCWLAYILLCRDIEMACDEKVVRDWEAHDKKAYSEALLSCSVPHRMAAACPLAFGEVGVKERVKAVLNYKKPAFWLVVAAVAACVVVAACFLTDPLFRAQETGENGTFHTQKGEATTALPEGSAEPALSLNDVIMLSAKGEDLTWADFDNYSYIETGSGLYIRVYEIDEQFSLMIGGGSPEEAPMYIRLAGEVNPDDYIDVRTESVADFISAHRMDSVDYFSTLEKSSWVYHNGDDPMHTAAVSLYDSGEFLFTFSPLSSYIGYGTYTMENHRLTLKTTDGNYTYVFDMVNDTLVFDGAASSTIIWYSGITNGAVFDKKAIQLSI